MANIIKDKTKLQPKAFIKRTKSGLKQVPSGLSDTDYQEMREWAKNWENLSKLADEDLQKIKEMIKLSDENK